MGAASAFIGHIECGNQEAIKCGEQRKSGRTTKPCRACRLADLLGVKIRWLLSGEGWAHEDNEELDGEWVLASLEAAIETAEAGRDAA
jgi:hypothetical protein